MDWFCIKCGRKILSREEYHNGLCSECYLSHVDDKPFIKNKRIKVCSHCLSYKSKEKWIPVKKDTLEEVLNFIAIKLIKEASKTNQPNLDIKIEPDLDRINWASKSELTLPVTIIQEAVNHEFTGKKETKETIHFLITVCDSCQRFIRGTYNAIMQIRTEGRKLDKDEENLIMDIIKETLAKANLGNRRVITQIKNMRFGFDVYLTTSKIGKKLSTQIAEHLACIVKESKKLVGRNNSGKLNFRIVYSVRLPKFKIGDLLKYEGDYLKVDKISKGKVYVYNVSSGVSTSLTTTEAWKADKIIPKSFLKKYSVIALENEYVDLMNMETYETTVINKPNFSLKIGQKVKCYTTDEGKLIIIP
ncbi:MAG: 60S ribosomal export protein NMD3 [Candidatus Odinarchaeia archaeon]